METIRIENLTFAYPLAEGAALKNVGLSVDQSEFVVLCGKSGCGKSTLLRHLKKNMLPYGKRKGEVLYCGQTITDLEDRRSVSEIGFVQQNPDNQIVTDKVWHELAFGLESLGVDNQSIKRRVAEMASYFDIQGWFRKSIDELSGGQKQLLNLASVMAMQPRLLILDEPTSQLDPIAAADFLQTVYRLNRDLGTTIIISEHRLEDIFPIADKIIVMDQGEVIACDEPREIGVFLAEEKGRPQNPHPMFYGLPSVMRIFSEAEPQRKGPLTIREGRLHLEEMLAGKAEKERTGPVFSVKSQIDAVKDPVIKLKDVWFKYSRDSGDVLRGLNLAVERNQWYCLLGGNGAGKSTVLKVISGILKPQRGKVEVALSALFMLPQNPQALFTEITVEEELLEAFYGAKLSDSEKIDEIEKMLALMEIQHLRKTNPYDLSGGEQQRLALGKILLLKPEILLLDEPTKGLDPFFKRTLARILNRLVESGVTVFMVSHDIEFCAEYADRCAMFFDGDVVSVGKPKEFFAGNSFYTTAANKIAREWKQDAVTSEEVARWLKTLL